MSSTVTPWFRWCYRSKTPNVWPPRAAELLAQHRASQGWWFRTWELCLNMFSQYRHGKLLGGGSSIFIDFPIWYSRIYDLHIFKMFLRQCKISLRSYWDHWSRVASWASNHPGKETRAMPVFFIRRWGKVYCHLRRQIHCTLPRLTINT